MNFVTSCVEWMQANNAKDHVGLFRKAGVESKILELKESTSHGDFSFDSGEDCHNISSLLKRYFREMVDPLLTHNLYESFIAADTEKGEQRITTISKVLSMLPKPNLKLLKTMCKYLYEVAANSEINLMYATNLAIVFAPNILRPLKETPLKLISDAGHAAALVRTLIEEAETIFDKVTQMQAAEAETMRSTLRRNYTLHREQSKAAAKTLMKERDLTPEDLRKTMRVAGDNIKAGKTHTLRVFFEEGDGDGEARRPRARAKLSDIFSDKSPSGESSADKQDNSVEKQENSVGQQESTETSIERTSTENPSLETKATENPSDKTTESQASETKTPTENPSPPLLETTDDSEVRPKVRCSRTNTSERTRGQRKYNSLNLDSSSGLEDSRKSEHSPRDSPRPRKRNFDIQVVPENSEAPSLRNSDVEPSSKSKRQQARLHHRKSVHRPQLQILRDLAEQVQVEEKRNSLKLANAEEIFKAPGIVESIDLMAPVSARGLQKRTSSMCVTAPPQRNLKKCSSVGERDTAPDMLAIGEVEDLP
eukprot:TRINITY_DN15263_c0_g1_i1.p1 TRINITY_DN15263_c0_g1~~TRINITY_DN15263_c0_g1_i1.p1  ORF type:complete len:607 (-),score=96.36 TRINITY_DN15263_c0_g1_i1:94-1707(-)